MAKLSGNIRVLVYTDNQSTNSPTSRIVDINENLADENVTEFQPILLTMAASTTDQVINFNSITNPTKLFLFSDIQVEVKINGSPAIKTTRLYMDGSLISTLSISNTSTISSANIRLGVGK